MMKNPFYVLPDGTAFSYAPVSNQVIRVTVRRPEGEKSAAEAVCALPEFRWESNAGFTGAELDGFKQTLSEKYNEIVAAAAKPSGKQPSDGSEKQQKKKKLLPLLIAAAALVVIGIVAVAVILRGGKTPAAPPDYTFPEGVKYSAPEEVHLKDGLPGVRYADNEILLVLKTGNNRTLAETLAEKYEAEIVGYIDATGDYQLRLKSVNNEEELLALAEDLQAEEGVAYAGPHYLFELDDNGVDYTVNTGANWQQALTDDTDEKGESWHMEMINAPAAWKWMNDRRDALSPVVIGVIDNGFDVGHEDLRFASVLNNTDLSDLQNYRHGTVVSGIMAADGSNDEGIVGVYPYGGGRLHGISLYGLNDQLGASDFAYKVSLCLLFDQKVKVINVSQGYPTIGVYADYARNVLHDEALAEEYALYERTEGRVLGDYLQRYLDEGVDFVIVNSAGNSSGHTYDLDIDIDGVKKTVTYQAGAIDSLCNSPFTEVRKEEYPDVYNRILVVGALTSEHDITSFSCVGERVDIYAPGQDIYSTDNTESGYNGGYNGTSFASPMIAGAAADVWTVAPGLTGDKVKTILQDATVIQDGIPKQFDLLQAVQFAADLADEPQPPAADDGVRTMRADNVGPASASIKDYVSFINEYRLDLENGQYVEKGDPLPVFGSAEFRSSIATIQFDSGFSGMPPTVTAEVSLDPEHPIYVWTAECTDTSIENYRDLREMHICTDGKIRPESCAFLFFGYTNLVRVDFNGVFDTSGVTDFTGMFARCHRLREADLTQLDLSAAETVDFMFAYCYVLASADLSRANNLQNATGFQGMMEGTRLLSSVAFPETPFGGQAEYYNAMFWESGITEFRPGGMDTSAATDMNGMFGYCVRLRTADLSTFNTANVTTMAYMFAECNALTSLDLSSFSTDKVTDLDDMFFGCDSLNAENTNLK